MALWRVIACAGVSLGAQLITGCTVHVYQYPAEASSVTWQSSAEMHSVSQRSASPGSGVSAPPQPVAVSAPPQPVTPPSPPTARSWAVRERTQPSRKPSRWLLSSSPSTQRQDNSRLPQPQPTPSTQEPARRPWRLINSEARLATTLANNRSAPLLAETDQTARAPIPFKQTLVCPVGFLPPCPGTLLKPAPVQNAQ